MRFYNDKALATYVAEQSKLASGSGEIDALPLVGLTSEGLELLITYVNGTADVQTAAFLASFFPQGEVKSSPNWAYANDWIESYRELLNTWKLWHIRAKFDVHRRSTQRDTDLIGAREGVYPNPPEAEPLTPSITLECTYCNKSISLVRNLHARIIESLLLTNLLFMYHVYLHSMKQ